MTIHIRSKERVAKHGEVFTPEYIVHDMHKLIPKKAWADTSMIYLEPTCGNGNFVVKAVEKKIEAGLSIIQALNTTFGMDIMQDNIDECHQRLLGLVIDQLKKGGVARGTDTHRAVTARAMLIMAHNVFWVKDSLAFIRDGKWEKLPFLYEDPTGGSGVLITEEEAEASWLVSRCPRKVKVVKGRATKIKEKWEEGHDLFKRAPYSEKEIML